jgi:predicted CXXCH cytochrome family protein
MPYEERQCLSCHDAHMSPNPILFRQPIEKLCISCHRMDTEWHRPIQHTPFENSQCLDCHVGHVSSHEGLIKHDQTTLCYSCHYDRDRELSRPIQHQPYGAGRCTDCHEPHSSVGKQLLPRTQMDEFCYMCHTDFRDMAKGGFSHAGAFGSKSCLGCHEHHSAFQRYLLRSDQSGNSFCFSCHDFPYYTSTAHFGLNCSECHQIHGSPYPYFIRRYELDLCNQCHEGFRHRTTNHPVGEPNKDILRNRTLLCSSCHDPHGTQFVKLTVRGKNNLCMPCHDEIR